MVVRIAPHPGQQTKALSCDADILVYGGKRGGGKSHNLILEPLRHIKVPFFNACIFRKNYDDIMDSGGLWTTAESIYPLVGGKPNRSAKRWDFPSGSSVSFHHMSHPSAADKYQGREINLLQVDEAQQIDWSTINKLWASNRSGKTTIESYCRLTCNPDADCWLADFLSWWWDAETGYAIPERDGVVRWMAIVKGEARWAASREELHDQYGADVDPKSVTFIEASVEDNPTLLERDPGYIATLKNLPPVEYERWYKGNWLVRDAEGSEWPGHCFGKHLWLPHGAEFPDIPLLRVISVDPSKGKESRNATKTRKGDYSAIVCAGISEDLVYIDANLARRNPSAIVDDLFSMCEHHQPHAVCFETNMMQSLFIDLIDQHRQRHSGSWLGKWLERNEIIEIENTMKKEVRIRRLSPWVTGHKLRFTDTSGSRLAVSQMRQFPEGDHDDGPDAVDMAIQTGLEIFTMPGERVAGVLAV